MTQTLKPQKKRPTSAIILIIVLVMLLASSYMMGSQVVEASTRLVTNQQTMDAYQDSWKLEGFDAEQFKSKYQIETVELTSTFDGHSLPFDLITAEGNENIVVMVHGMMGNRLTNYPTAEIFLENGYNVITYDQRSSGENLAQRSTFGFWEKFDLIDCISYAKEHAPKADIVVWGESFGGATAILGVAQEEVQRDISALILDCPVSSMASMISAELEKMDLPVPTSYLLACGNLVNQLKLHFAYEDADCTAAAAKITVPTLIFNSKADQITPEFMGQDIYDHLASQQKELFTSETSAHIEIRNHERDTYVEKILGFLG